MGCGSSCGKGNPVEEPGSPVTTISSPLPTERPVTSVQIHSHEDLERQEQEQLAAQQERDEKARERQREAEQRAALARQKSEQQHAEALALVDALENMDEKDDLTNESSSSSEDEDDMPEFLMGKKVKLRDPTRGKMRRAKINLKSGYDVSKVAKLVDKDLEWHEPENSDEEEDIRTIPFAVTLEMDFDDIDDEYRTVFEEEIIDDIASAAGIPKELLRVAGLRKGSVIVDMELEGNDALLGQDRTADAVVLNLMAQSKDAESALLRGKHTCRAQSILSPERLEDPAKAKHKPPPQTIPLWRTVVLYICSTLEGDRGKGDLDDERAVLYRDVLPRLKVKYAQRMIHLLTVDPRLSCAAEPTSTEEAGDVVKTAAWGAELGQPCIVIALRGSRHGWRPEARTDVPEGFQAWWRRRMSLQLLEIQVAMHKAACALVYYRSKAGREEADDDAGGSSSNEEEEFAPLAGSPLKQRPHTIAGEGGGVGQGEGAASLLPQRPHTSAVDDGAGPAKVTGDADARGGGTLAREVVSRSLSGLAAVAEDGGNEGEEDACDAPSHAVEGGNFGHGRGEGWCSGIMLAGRNFGSAESDGSGGDHQQGSGGDVSRRPTSGLQDAVSSRLGSASTSNSIGSAQARQELRELDAEMQQMVHGVMAGVAGEFPASHPSSARSCSSSLGGASRRPSSANRPMRVRASRTPSASRTPLGSARSQPGSARSQVSARSSASSVGTQQAREELERLDADVGQLVDSVMSRALPTSGASTPAYTGRSGRSSVAGSEDMRRIGAVTGGMVDDVLAGVVGACSSRSVGSSVATDDARHELLRVADDVDGLLDDVMSQVLGACTNRTSFSTSSSVGTVQAREELGQIGSNVSNLLDGVLSGVTDSFPSARTPASARSQPSVAASAQPSPSSAVCVGVNSEEKPSRPGSSVGAGGDARSGGALDAVAQQSVDVGTDGLWQDSDSAYDAEGDRIGREQMQAEGLRGDSSSSVLTPRGDALAAEGREQGGFSRGPSAHVKEVVVVQETDEALLKRERRRLRRSENVCVRHYAVNFVAAQTRPNTAGLGEETVMEEWDEMAAAAAADEATGKGRSKILGGASWNKLKSAINVSAAFSSSWEKPPDRVSPESLSEFAETVSKDIEEVLDQVCREWGQAEPMQDIIHKERAVITRQLATQSPPVARLRTGMGPEKTKRMLERAAKQHSKNATRPSFNEIVSWQCHQKLWRRRSKTLVGDGGRPYRQLLSKVREGSQTILLLGERGSGKTALVSRMVRRFSSLNNEGWIVLAHHAGAGNAEFSIRSALQRFCGELCQALRLYAPPPGDTKLVDAHFNELLVKATSLYGANILLVIDGYDQMDNVDSSNSHTWIPQGEILGLQVVLTLEANSTCHTRILSRIDDPAEVTLPPLDAQETTELAKSYLAQLLPGFEPTDLPIHDLVHASQLGLRPPLWIVTACRVIKGLVELFGFTQFSPSASSWNASPLKNGPGAPALKRSASLLSRSGSLPRSGSGGTKSADKVLVPGSNLHSTICDMIRNQWSKDWADVAALLDSLIVAMEQLFSQDLVRDMISLLVSSPAGLTQHDLLLLLGYGFVVDDTEGDEHNSVNPSPQLSPYSPNSLLSSPLSARHSRTSPRTADMAQYSDAASEATDLLSPARTSAVHIQISATSFGYSHHMSSGPGSDRTACGESCCKTSLTVAGGAFGAAHDQAHLPDRLADGASELTAKIIHDQDHEVFTRILSSYSEAIGPADLSRCSSSMSHSMFVRVTSSRSFAQTDSLIGVVKTQEERSVDEGPLPAQEEAISVTFVEFLRMKAVLDPLLQDQVELHPSALRFADRTVQEVLRARLLSDADTAAEIHHHIADHFVLSAGGSWHQSTGVIFAAEAATLLGQHMVPLRWLPYQLQGAKCWTDSVQLLCNLHFLQARMHSAMLEQHIEDCAALSRGLEEEITHLDAFLLELQRRNGTTRKTRTVRTAEQQEGEDAEALVAQLRALHLRILEMLSFLQGDRRVLTMMPKLTAQQAANQPHASIPELLGKNELMSEPKGTTRYGKKSVRAKAAQEEIERTRKTMHLYSPIAGYRAVGGAADEPRDSRLVEIMEEGDGDAEEEAGVEYKDDEDGASGDEGLMEAHECSISSQQGAAEGEQAGGILVGENPTAAKDESQEDKFQRLPSAGAEKKPVMPDVLEEKEEEEEEKMEEEPRFDVWVEHVNKDSAIDKTDVRMGMAFMHVAMSSDEVPSCDESLACVSGGDGTMRLYDMTTMRQVYEFSGHADSVNMCTFNLSCDLLASASDDCSLRLWRLPDYDVGNRRITNIGKCVRVLRGVPQGYPHGHSDAVTQCDFTPDGLVLVSASDDKTVKTWDVDTGLIFCTLRGHIGWVTAICCSPFRSQLISGGDDGMIILWDIGVDPDVANEQGTARAIMLGTEIAHSAPIVALNFSPDGRFVASAAADSTVVVYQASSLFLLAKIRSLPAPPLSINFDREAWRLWILTDGGRLLVYEIENSSSGPNPQDGMSPSLASPSSPDASPRRKTQSPSASPRRMSLQATGGKMLSTKKHKGKQEPIATYFLPRISGGNHYTVSPHAGNTCVCVCGDGSVLELKLHNAVHTELPPPTPRQAPRPGVIRIKDDEDDTEEIEWEEFSGPLCVAVERVGGSEGRVSAHFSTRGTNDDDPDFVAAEGILEWEDGDTEDKLIWLGMHSYNGIEWDARACATCTHPDTGQLLRLEGCLASFGAISFAEGYVAITRPWHPPLVNKADFMHLEVIVEDAEREERNGFVLDDKRLVTARQRLKWAQSLGKDADVGLTNWTVLQDKICVLDPDCVPGTTKEGFADPELRRRAISEFVLNAAKMAHSAGARAVIVPIPPNGDGSTSLFVPRVPAPDMFDETTGKWDPDALDADRVPIPVICVAPPELSDPAAPTGGAESDNDAPPAGLGRGVMREGTSARVQPEAPNHAFYQRTGIKPLVYLDMVGDTDFDVVLLRADRCELDKDRASATVRIVTSEVKGARIQSGAHKAAQDAHDKEEQEAQAAEAVARKERQEADEAEAAFQAELREAKLAEEDFEANSASLHEAEDAANKIRRAAEAREAEADSLLSKCSNGRLLIKEMQPRLHELSSQVKAQGKRRKTEPPTPLEEELAALTDKYNSTSRMVDECAAELATITAEMDSMWQAVEDAQRLAEERQAAVFAAEVYFRKEKAEAERARIRRDKEVAEAEEAEENARRERAEAEAAMEAARKAAEEAASARAREQAQREDFERRVQEAAYAMERAEAAKISAAKEAKEVAQREQRKERERMLKFLAAQEEKRILEAEEQAKQRRASEAKFEELSKLREEELEKLRASAEAADGGAPTQGGTSPPRTAGAGLPSEDTERFPWRQSRKTLEPGFTRQPRPALANDFMHVVQGWEGDGDKSRRGNKHDDHAVLDSRILNATVSLPQHLLKAATGAAQTLATADYLQALKEWDAIDGTSVLEGDTLKLSGRQAPDADREFVEVSLADLGVPANTRDSLVGGIPTPQSSNSRTATPATGATSAQLSRVQSQASRQGTARSKYLRDDDAPAFSRRPSTDLAAVQERLVLEEGEDGNA